MYHSDEKLAVEQEQISVLLSVITRMRTRPRTRLYLDNIICSLLKSVLI